MADKPLRVGVLSDTHGLLRSEARSFLLGCDYLIHGGDIGGADILDTLRAIAPLTVVCGNNDRADWANDIAASELVRIGKIFVYVIHDIAELDIAPAAIDVRVVISGHSHKPCITEKDQVLYLNPGSCWPRRFKLPISVGELLIDGDRVRARTVELAVS